MLISYLYLDICLDPTWTCWQGEGLLLVLFWLLGVPSMLPGGVWPAEKVENRNNLVLQNSNLGIVAGVVGKLDSDGLGRSLRNGSIELGDGSLCLHTLVKSNEANSFWEAGYCSVLGSTGDVVAQDPAGDDVAAAGEQPLQVRLGHVLGQPGHIQISPLDGFTAGAGEGDLQK